MKLAGMRRGNMRVALQNMENAGFVMAKVPLIAPAEEEKMDDGAPVVAKKVKPKMVTSLRFEVPK